MAFKEEEEELLEETNYCILEKEKRMFCTRVIKTCKGRKRDFSIGRVNDLSIVLLKKEFS